ncbi:hypothetical protein C9374_009734 [Naegleria lovaniensis]|uniref:RRM domain-containing protein n=1 Tax=Naegleria lovaniensis TaxID=51637 RepID=A0AA88KRD9_NAELO|nr:uncharacterized protein C9374_009734 [Naegleria lovaniensis]KAG2393157.1 hypothetical protein C9374_009734 [Naegleria lovaniensis]
MTIATPTSSTASKSWADQEEEGNIVQIIDDKKTGIKTIIEEKMKDGKKVRIVKKIKTVKVQKKHNPLVEERRKWKKFGSAQSGNLPEVTAVGEPINFEYTNNKKQSTALQTVMDEQELLLNRIQMQLAKEATETKEEASENEPQEDEDKLKAPSSGAYIPPSLKNKQLGAGTAGRSDVNTTIRVGNLDQRATESDLRLLFGDIGRIVKVYLPFNNDRTRNRGFALITYTTPEDCEKAIDQFDGFSLNHLLLNVEWSKTERKF